MRHECIVDVAARLQAVAFIAWFALAHIVIEFGVGHTESVSIAHVLIATT